MAIVERPSNEVQGIKGSQSLITVTPPRMLPKFSASVMQGKGGSRKTGSAGTTSKVKLPGARGFKR